MKTAETISAGAMIFILIASLSLMLYASAGDSATMDELAHIPAGYGYVKYLDYRLNPEHPPLVKALAALPLVFQKLNFPADRSPWQNDINGQWAAGAQFLYESGNDADKIVFWSRIGPIILTLLLIALIYVWAKELAGPLWALLPAFLFAFSPTVLSHGHYVTTDVGAALGIGAAVYFFVKFLLKQSRRNLILSGLTFGVAQLMKFSAVLLVPYLLFLTAVYLAYSLKQGQENFWRLFFKHLKNIAVVFVVGAAVIYAAYFVTTFNYPIEKQKADTEFILGSFSGGPDPDRQSCRIISDLDAGRRTRCLAEINIWMAGNKVLRPFGEYLLGLLMVMQRSTGGNTGYFLGEVFAAGWWYYFPTVFVLKEPLPSLILIFLALLLSLRKITKAAGNRLSKVKQLMDYLGTHFSEFSMTAFVVFYWTYSLASPLNIGVRHILPTLPFIYILSAGAVKKWTESSGGKAGFSKKTLTVALAVWFLFETALATPYFLSYFNQAGGGLQNGYRYVTDSNYDWGQDLKRLKKFADENNINKIAVDYFGGGNPKYYLGEKSEYWQSARGDPEKEGIGWLAVSVNTLQGALGELRPGQPRRPEDEYRWLKEIKDVYNPDYRAGTSIFIYKLN